MGYDQHMSDSQNDERIAETDTSIDQGTPPSVACSRRQDDEEEDGGCSRRELEARCAAEATARVAAEERAERAERAAAELKAMLKSRRSQGEQGGHSTDPTVATTVQRGFKQLHVELGTVNVQQEKAEEMLREKREACGKCVVATILVPVNTDGKSLRGCVCGYTCGGC